MTSILHKAIFLNKKWNYEFFKHDAHSYVYNVCNIQFSEELQVIFLQDYCDIT